MDRNQGRIQDFKLGGALKKLAEGGAKYFGVFRVKNHDFTPKNLIFSNFRGGGRASGPGSAPGNYCLIVFIVCHTVIHRKLQNVVYMK